MSPLARGGRSDWKSWAIWRCDWKGWLTLLLAILTFAGFQVFRDTVILKPQKTAGESKAQQEPEPPAPPAAATEQAQPSAEPKPEVRAGQNDTPADVAPRKRLDAESARLDAFKQWASWMKTTDPNPQRDKQFRLLRRHREWVERLPHIFSVTGFIRDQRYSLSAVTDVSWIRDESLLDFPTNHGRGPWALPVALQSDWFPLGLFTGLSAILLSRRRQPPATPKGGDSFFGRVVNVVFVAFAFQWVTVWAVTWICWRFA